LDTVILILVGLGVGFCSGMFGIGGAVLMTPILVLLGYPDNIALATPLVGAVFSAISGGSVYFKEKLINYRVGLITVLSALSTAWIGVLLTSQLPSIIIYIKAIFMFFLAISLILPMKEGEKQNRLKSNVFIIIIIGAFTGFTSALLAIGGGIVFIFAFARILKLGIKETIATSLFCVGIIALMNSILHFTHGNIDMMVALSTIIGIIPAAYLGSKVAINMSNQKLKYSFAVTLSVFAVLFIIWRYFN